MKYAILGGGCSFAIHLTRLLLSRNETESVLSIGRSPLKSRCFTLGVADDSRYSYHPLHVTYHLSRVLKVLDDTRPDVIFNFAAQGESSASFSQSWRYFETNCVGSARLVENMITKDWFRKLVHVSSGEVYGSSDHTHEETDPLNPTSPYAISKAAFDQYLQVLQRRKGLPIVIVRPSNIYGEGQQLWRVIPRAILFGLTGRKLPLYGRGLGQKSYMHAEDLARALLLCAGARDGSVYNVASEEPVSIRHVTEMIAEKLGLRHAELCEDVGERRGTDARYWFDSSAIKDELGWKREVHLGQGVDRVISWVRENLEELRVMSTEFQMRA